MGGQPPQARKLPVPKGSSTNALQNTPWKCYAYFRAECGGPAFSHQASCSVTLAQWLGLSEPQAGQSLTNKKGSGATQSHGPTLGSDGLWLRSMIHKVLTLAPLIFTTFRTVRKSLGERSAHFLHLICNDKTKTKQNPKDQEIWVRFCCAHL